MADMRAALYRNYSETPGMGQFFPEHSSDGAGAFWLRSSCRRSWTRKPSRPGLVGAQVCVHLGSSDVTCRSAEGAGDDQRCDRADHEHDDRDRHSGRTDRDGTTQLAHLDTEIVHTDPDAVHANAHTI